MTIRERENQLFRNWYRSRFLSTREQFVMDGVVDETEWEDTPINVLIFADRIHAPVHVSDECEWLYRYEDGDHQEKSPEIEEFIQWLSAIFHGTPQETQAVLSSKITDTHKQWLLRQMAIINSSKVRNDTMHRQNEVISRLFLRSQLDLYACDFVLCAGTTGYLQQLDTKYAADKWKEADTGISYLRRGRTVYLDMASLMGNGQAHECIVKTLESIEKKENIHWNRPLPI